MKLHCWLWYGRHWRIGATFDIWFSCLDSNGLDDRCGNGDGGASRDGFVWCRRIDSTFSTRRRYLFQTQRYRWYWLWLFWCYWCFHILFFMLKICRSWWIRFAHNIVWLSSWSCSSCWLRNGCSCSYCSCWCSRLWGGYLFGNWCYFGCLSCRYS